MKLFDIENSDDAIGASIIIADDPFEYRCLFGLFYDKVDKYFELHLFFIKIEIK